MIRTLFTTCHFKAFTAALLGSTFLGKALAQDVFIDDVKIVTNSSLGTFESADIIISDGEILSLGADLTAPTGAQIIQGEGYWVTPGLFAAMAQTGLVEIGAESSTNDTRAKDATTSVSDRVADSFNPKSPVIDNTRIEGITHAALTSTPANSIFSGTGFVANMSGDFGSVEDEAAFVYVQYGSRGADLAGGTRAAAMSQLRGALEDARNFASRYGGPDDGDALSRRDAQAMVDILRGRIPLVVGADRASDILTLIDLTREYGRLDLIVMGAAEGWMVKNELFEAGIKVMIDPLENLPRSFDRVGSRIDNAKILSDAGVEIAFTTRSAGVTHNIRVLPQHAGNAVGDGLDWEKAFAAISSTPAGWFGVESGEIKRGDAATLIVWDGDPLEVTSSPQMIMINGAAQSLESRQTKLRDRYNPTNESVLNFKYRN